MDLRYVRCEEVLTVGVLVLVSDLTKCGMVELLVLVWSRACQMCKFTRREQSMLPRVFIVQVKRSGDDGAESK